MRLIIIITFIIIFAQVFGSNIVKGFCKSWTIPERSERSSLERRVGVIEILILTWSKKGGGVSPVLLFVVDGDKGF